MPSILPSNRPGCRVPLDADVRERRGRAPAPQAAARRRRSACSRSSASTRASPATSPRATPSCADHFWVNPFGDALQADPGRDLILVNHEGEVVEGEHAGQRRRLRHPLAGARRPPRRRRRRPLALACTARRSRRSARPLDPITQDACAFYERPRAVRRLHRRRARRRGGQAHRPRPRREQGGHPAQPRPAHRRARRSTRPSGGSSRWSAAARPSCSPRPPARRS